MDITVSIIIPVKDENDPFVNGCIESLKQQDYDGSYEIIVVEGGNRAQARNRGIKIARGGIVAFIDADCIAPRDWLANLVDSIDDSVGGVGGINFTIEGIPELAKAQDFIFSTTLGSFGSASFSTTPQTRMVPALACITSAYKKQILLSVGGFDEKFVLCEDTNISLKVRKAGHKLLLRGDIFVYHLRTNGLLDFVKKFFGYGQGRARSILTSKSYVSKSVIGLAVLLALFPLALLTVPILMFMLLGLYIGLVFTLAIKATLKFHNKAFLGLVPTMFILEHSSYALGLFSGVAKGKWKSVDKQANVKILEYLLVENNQVVNSLRNSTE